MGDTGSLALGMALGAWPCSRRPSSSAHHRRPVRRRGPVRDDPGALLQKDPQAHLPHGAFAPSFREEGMERDEGGRALLDRLRRAGRVGFSIYFAETLMAVAYVEGALIGEEARAAPSGARARFGLGKSGRAVATFCRFWAGAWRLAIAAGARTRRRGGADAARASGALRVRDDAPGVFPRGGRPFDLCVASPASRLLDVLPAAAAVSAEVVSEVELAWRESSRRAAGWR